MPLFLLELLSPNAGANPGAYTASRNALPDALPAFEAVPAAVLELWATFDLTQDMDAQRLNPCTPDLLLLAIEQFQANAHQKRATTATVDMLTTCALPALRMIALSFLKIFSGGSSSSSSSQVDVPAPSFSHANRYSLFDVRSSDPQQRMMGETSALRTLIADCGVCCDAVSTWTLQVYGALSPSQQVLLQPPMYYPVSMLSSHPFPSLAHPSSSLYFSEDRRRRIYRHGCDS